jgi:hypothetical protein
MDIQIVKITSLSENDADDTMYIGYYQTGYGGNGIIGDKGYGSSWGANYDYGDSGYGNGSACGSGLDCDLNITWIGRGCSWDENFIIIKE